MRVRITHTDGNVYTIPVEQVVVTQDDGTPIACTYKTHGLIVHADASQKDWSNVVNELGLAK
jgi:hypothetical protein